tara:strand:- start:1145 stop:1312 length:168 start_codon:yes stop_codon:yes gene_type:complete
MYIKNEIPATKETMLSEIKICPANFKLLLLSSFPDSVIKRATIKETTYENIIAQT